MTGSPQKICYVCHDGALYGAQQSLRLVLLGLPQERYTPVISTARPGPLNELLAQEFPHLQQLKHKRVQWFKHDRRHFFQRVGDVLTLLIIAWPRATQLAQHIEQHGVSAVHTNAVVSLEGALAARLVGVPHIWHVRELFMHGNPKLIPTLGRKLTARFIVALSDVIITNSNATRDQFGALVAKNPGKFRVIYNAVVAAQNHASPPAQNKRSKTAGYVGRLSEGKRFHDLLAAVHAIRHLTGEDLRLLVAGTFVDAPYEAYIHERIAAWELTEAVEFLGHQADLAPVYAAMDFMVLPSTNEAFGRVLIEAMQAGVPCIGANAGGIAEIITHEQTGLLFEGGDLPSLRDAMLTFIENPELRQQMAENAGRMVRDRFTIASHMAAIEACYQDCLASLGRF